MYCYYYYLLSGPSWKQPKCNHILIYKLVAIKFKVIVVRLALSIELNFFFSYSICAFWHCCLLGLKSFDPEQGFSEKLGLEHHHLVAHTDAEGTL